ncbi:MAG: DUF1501 domain-containing protein, partial [Bacteroidota bacterium]
MNPLSRRKFIKQASCAAMGSTAFLSTALNLGLINTISARPHIMENTEDYKAMVCILLAGGCDTHNVLVPTDPIPYAAYSNIRGPMALDKEDPSKLLPLNNMNGESFHVHAGMQRVQSLFNEGNLAFISNIGTLIEPIQNYADYDSGLKRIPIGLYSHRDQIMHWQTSVPQNRSAIGFGGRMADILQDMNSINEVSLNISMSGKNPFSAGNSTSEIAIKTTNSNDLGLDGIRSSASNAGFLNDAKSNAIKSMAEAQYSNIFHQTIGQLTKESIQSNEILKIAFEQINPLSSNFSATSLSQNLKKVAETISVRNFLGTKRQIFFITYGGWDHHSDVIPKMEA